jgi:hypothetical protein
MESGRPHLHAEVVPSEAADGAIGHVDLRFRLQRRLSLQESSREKTLTLRPLQPL